MKIKNFQIQQLALRDSVMNPKNNNVLKQIKSKFHDVKGIFQEELDEVEKLIKKQRQFNI